MPAAKLIRIAIAALLFGTLASSVATAQRRPVPSDPQIAHIAYTAGAVDIETARLALEKSHNPAVLAFARDMIRDHTAVNGKTLALVKRLGITPEDNPTSQALVKESGTVRAELAKLSGEAFDRAYIDNEIAYHRTVNQVLRSELIPHARNRRLRHLLATALKMCEGHKMHAEQIAGRMG